MQPRNQGCRGEPTTSCILIPPTCLEYISSYQPRDGTWWARLRSSSKLPCYFAFFAACQKSPRLSPRPFLIRCSAAFSNAINFGCGQEPAARVLLRYLLLPIQLSAVRSSL